MWAGSFHWKFIQITVNHIVEYRWTPRPPKMSKIIAGTVKYSMGYLIKIKNGITRTIFRTNDTDISIDDLQMNHVVLICLDYYLVNNENYRYRHWRQILLPERPFLLPVIYWKCKHWKSSIEMVITSNHFWGLKNRDFYETV